MKHGSCIRGLGAYIPEEIRTNDWWPEEWVDSWRKQNKGPINRLEDAGLAGDDFIHPYLREAIETLHTDPFAGLRERRVAPPDMLPSDMEIIAAKEAMANAGIGAQDIDLVMSFSLPSDYIHMPTAHRIHHELGLTNAMALGVHSVCFSINSMTHIAHQFIANGVYKHALVLTSCKWSNGLDYSSSMSVMSGDGATAWVLGPCSVGQGLQTVYERSETEYHDALLWVNRFPSLASRAPYAFGPDQNQMRLLFSAVKPIQASKVVARVPYWAQMAGKAALEQAGWAGSDVDLFVPNSATAWYGPIAARILGIAPEALEDNTLLFGNMGGTNLPMNLYMAWKKGRLKPGTRILFFGHGAGCSYGAFTFVWPED